MRIVALFILLACSCSVNAERICTWKANGRTHFGNVDVPRGAKCRGVEANVIETEADNERDQAALNRWEARRQPEPEPVQPPAVTVNVDER